MTVIGQAVETNTARNVDRTFLQKAHDLGVDPVFVARVTAALQQICITDGLAIRALPDGPTEAQKATVVFYGLALQSPTTYGAAFAGALAAAGPADRASDDATILFQVSRVVPMFANLPI